MATDGKVYMVTGGSSGIGAATAKLLAQRGAKVTLVSRGEDELQAVAEQIKSDGGAALAITADITDEDRMKFAYRSTVDAWGRLDGVFANAGINGKWAPITEMSVEDWNKTMSVNLDGTFITLKYAVPYLKDNNGGSIVITSSVNGTRMFSTPGAFAYATTKAGQVALAKMLALELAKFNIRVNAICPGRIDTEISDSTTKVNADEAGEPMNFPEGEIPLTDGKAGTSAQVADLVTFLLAEQAAHITGTEMWIDGGQSLLRG